MSLKHRADVRMEALLKEQQFQVRVVSLARAPAAVMQEHKAVSHVDVATA